MNITKPTQNIIIFTDLDGTLLDHHTYDFAPALFMLEYLKKQNIPVILTTSKTKEEVLLLQNKLDINYPFIVENGAGIFFPSKDKLDVIHLGITYDKTLETFKKYKKDFILEGFFQMSDEKVAQLTGLDLEDAKLARSRSYGEPFLFDDTKDYIALRQLARNEGYDIVKGGRFYHLITKGIDKANSVLHLKKIYEEKFNAPFKTIALGDGNNDLTMLEAVDTPILIPKYDGNYISHTIKHITKAKYPGPKGWNQALKEYFNVSF
jgi:mannosyl-3-phosphoglycerate phosphatase